MKQNDKSGAAEKSKRAKKNAPVTNTLLGFFKKSERQVVEDIVDDEIEVLPTTSKESSSPDAVTSSASIDVIDIDDTPAKPVHPFFASKSSTKTQPESSPTDTTQVPSEPTDSSIRRSSRRTAVIQRYNDIDDSDEEVAYVPPPRNPKRTSATAQPALPTSRSNGKNTAAKTFFMTKDQKLELKAQEHMNKFQEERLKSRQASQQFYSQRSNKSAVNPFLMMRQAARELDVECAVADSNEEFNPFPEYQHINAPTLTLMGSSSAYEPMIYRLHQAYLATGAFFSPSNKDYFVPFPDKSHLLHAWIKYVTARYDISKSIVGDNRAFVDIVEAQRPTFAGSANHAYTKLLQWLQQWSQPAYDSDDDCSAASNICVLRGDSGACKSSLAHAAAKACGFTIIEVNTTHVRSLANVKKMVAETAQSRRVTNSADRNLILFDEANVLFEDDAGLYAAISQLAKDSKCPILVVSEHEVSIKSLTSEPHVITCYRPDKEALASYLYDTCCDYCSIPIDMYRWLAQITDYNARTCLNTLHLLFTTGVEDKEILATSDTSFEDTLVANRLGGYTLSRQLQHTTVHDTPSPRTHTLHIPHISAYEPAILNFRAASIVRIHGMNFLQRGVRGEVLPVHVMIDDVPAEVRLVSDTLLCVQAPYNTDTGRYIACVILRVGGTDELSVSCESRVQVINECYPLISTIGESSRSVTKTQRKVQKIVSQPDSDDDFDTSTVSIKRRRIVDDDDDIINTNSNCSNTSTDDDEDIFIRRPKASCSSCINDDDSVGSVDTVLDNSHLMDAEPCITAYDDTERHDPEPIATSQLATQVDEVLPTPILNTELKNVMLDIVDMLMKLPVAEPFLLPLQTSKLPRYRSLVAYPMDLSTIKASVQESLYENIEALTGDVSLMCRNCLVYNGVDAEISQWAIELYTCYMDKLVQLGLHSPSHVSDELPPVPTISSLNERLSIAETRRQEEAASAMKYCISSDYIDSLNQLDALCSFKSDSDIWSMPLCGRSEGEMIMSDFTLPLEDTFTENYWEKEPLVYAASDMLHIADALYSEALSNKPSEVFKPLSYEHTTKRCRIVYDDATRFLPKLSSCLNNCLQSNALKRSISVDIVPQLLSMLRAQGNVVQMIAQDTRVRSTRQRNKMLDLRYSYVSQVLPVDESVFDELLNAFRLKIV